MCSTQLFAAIDEVALPIVKTAATRALEESMSPQQAHSYVTRVMSGYEYSDKTVIPTDDPLGRLDVTALWFLLFPYSEDSKEQKSGLMEDHLAEYYGLNRDKIRKIRIIRTLRNAVFHKTPENMAKYDAKYTTDMGAMDLLEDALRPLDVNISQKLSPIRREIDAKLSSGMPYTTVSPSEKRKQRLQKSNSMYFQMMNAMRQDYERERNWQFAKAPLGEPIMGVAPWLEEDDLSSLPWPMPVAPFQGNQR